MITKVEKEKLSLKNILKKNLFTLGIISFCFLVDRLTKIKILELNPDINKIFLNLINYIYTKGSYQMG